MITYHNNILLMGISLGEEEEEKVYICVKANMLLVSCSVDTDDSYLSQYAYFTLEGLVLGYNYGDFRKFYWLDFFDGETGKCKYLSITNNGKGLDIVLKPKYAFFLKPGHQMVSLAKDDFVLEKGMVDIDADVLGPDENCVIGYCLADTNLSSYYSNHYPFLIPYSCFPTKDRGKVKCYLKFIKEAHNPPGLSYTASEERLYELSKEMVDIAAVRNRGDRCVDKEGDEAWLMSRARVRRMFQLWHLALPFLEAKVFTHYYFTYGMRNVKGKPRRGCMDACVFSQEVPELCFLWTDKGDYYELEMRFKIDGKRYVPYRWNTAFFISGNDDRFRFFLLGSLRDYRVVEFFGRYGFKVSVLKGDFEGCFKGFVEELGKVYEMAGGKR
ncbi:hypothetical protein H7F33_08720 [Pedobacter sp. PAMC26386]|nr:hypothetical protein H7F33_08720 [Pedobacter sp. PAMC26386]